MRQARPVTVFILLLLPTLAPAVTTTYSRSAGLTAFSSVTGDSPVAIDFDSTPANTDVTNTSFRNTTFASQAAGAPLIVVRAADTFTPAGFSGAPDPTANTLPATSGPNVLSPGGVTLGPGPNAAVERDGLTLTFAIPLAGFGLDHLSQSADGFSFTNVVVRNTAGTALFNGAVPISNLGGAGAPAGADFWGVFSTNADIKSLTFTEGDENSQFPDCNVGYDSLRLSIGGDANYDWRIDADDFARTDRGFHLGLSGWSNGDYNADNAVTPADYLILDRAYALQLGLPPAPSLLADRSTRFGPDYVSDLLTSLPEPSAVAAAACLMFISPAQRRRTR